ncbi:alpha-mannosidase [Eisenbergiella tayi]|uniref:Mannosylglycerate hydrolase n=1 Tax=Eisenbergiella tayi TaxID=1432052 RepID=A0A1E3AGT0_9FIRM|nr:alpha-mannosidase [Eisenbergiella tayi]ODM07964.1 Mannosylglycerate hydrolase [Eisenbergiella tayi]OIZ64017.1 alpha-mannosidase [Eisenbergiella tayi]
MFLTLDKFRQRVRELGEKRYFGHSCIAPFISMEGNLPPDESYKELPEKVEGPEFGLHDFFVGRDRYLWLERTVKLPEAKEGCETVGLFDFGETGGGYNSGFESLLYVDGHPYQGVDTHHKEVIFRGKEGKEVCLTFLLWTGLEGGGEHTSFYHQCRQADVAYLHKKTDELYYFAKAITETLLLLPPENEQYAKLKAALDRTFSCINWDEESFYETAEKAHDMLMDELDRMEKSTEVTVNVVGHTHIDVAWLWRLKHTREKAQRSFSTVLRLMELYDEYIFLQTQPQLYKYVKEDCPELYEKIRQKAAEGKWEPDGGMWVEADCNLSSGEALVRQFLYGTRFLEQEFGKKCEYLWLPDVFGYSWALPQILKQCEINTFMTTKISWNQFNSIPDDLFWWRGIDGSEILTYFVNTPGEGQDMDTRYATYNGMVTPHAVLGSWNKFKNKDLSRDTLISYGYGDGGGGVTRDMLELRRAMDVIPGLPHVKSVQAGEFFRKLHENVENTDRYVHTWDGELYLEYHRGTYTSQAYNKKTNRHMENKLVQTEWLSSLAYILGGGYAGQELNDSWECVLLHQFHDIIPGSSIHEVYEDSRINYRTAEERADHVWEEALKTVIQEKEHTYSVYSTNSFGGKELVLIPEQEEGSFTDGSGRKLEAQKTERGYEVQVETEPFSAIPVIFIPGEKKTAVPKTASSFDGASIETPRYSIAWNEEGQLTRIYDKRVERSVLKEGQLGNVLEVYEDKPINFDAWDIDIFYTQKMERAKLAKAPELVENGSLKAVVRFVFRYHKSVIQQDMTVFRDSGNIDFVTRVDWQETHRLLKAAFYTDIRSVKASYDIQFGHVERPTHWNTSWDWARFEVCGHKWADLSETGYGVSLLNNCKYGYSIKDQAIKLSLLKSAVYPDTEADKGTHEFTYSLYPHEGSVTEGGTIEAASRLNLPAQAVPGQFADQRKIVKVSTDRVQIDAVKKAEDEDCLIVRLHECRGGRGKVKLSSEFPVKKLVPCNLLEHDCGEAVEGAEAVFPITPFEIKTFKMYL